MTFSAEDLYVMGLMAMDAANHNPTLSEGQYNELAVFSSQQTSLENNYCNMTCQDATEQGM